jgi:hypothetical protein
METNNWINEATWKVNLEIISNLCPEDFDLNRGKDMGLVDIHELADAFKERVIYYIECETSVGNARNFALAYLESVDWHQIALLFVEQYITE